MSKAMRISLLVTISIMLLLVACTNQENEPEPTPVPPTAIPVVSGADSIKIGVLANRSVAASVTLFTPMVNYLTETLSRPFELLPMEFDAVLSTVEDGNVDFIIANPTLTTQMKRLYGTEILAAISRRDSGAYFSGLIITRPDGSITTIDDMYGKDAACVDFETGAGGCLFQVLHLLEQGFDPHTDFGNFVENPSQDNIVLGVLNGTYDIGFIRTGQLENMIRDDKLISIDEVYIIDEVDDDFFYPHTTILYPEWGISALADTDSALAQSLKNALADMPSDYPGLEDTNIAGFDISVDYTPMETLIDTLQLPGNVTESSD